VEWKGRRGGRKEDGRRQMGRRENDELQEIGRAQFVLLDGWIFGPIRMRRKRRNGKWEEGNEWTN
jgi:hypothetical protein